ncbi:MAG: poly-gamma-glutamate synthase PgsB [Bacteroidetes bacterium]|nr:poly-gamma-glutamate synthase PgsB [Bacteroidota bacterium]
MNIVPIITAACLLALIAERWIVHRRISALRWRIHVNGTRGKSSVTRYIGAALTAAGTDTVVKVTGIVPTIVLPDGTLRVIERRGPARVQEQFSVIRTACRSKAHALVLECMSLKPEYQRLEARMFRPHITVITNIDDDHREEMGSTEEEHIAAIAESVPDDGLVIVSNVTLRNGLQQYAAQHRSIVLTAPPLSPERAAQLPRTMFAENVALALCVAEQAGIEPQRAFDAILAMAERSPEGPVTMTVNDRSVRFLNGFAVNDVPSAVRFLQRWESGTGRQDRIIILNTRHDRPLRTKEFLRWCVSLTDVHHFFITGSHAAYACRSLKSMGMPAGQFSHVQSSDVVERLRSLVRAETDIIGFGNIAGDGFTMIEQFNRKAAQPHGD